MGRRWTAREGGPVVLVEFADARFRGHKGNLSGFRFPSLLKIKQANKQTNFRSKRPWVQCLAINKKINEQILSPCSQQEEAVVPNGKIEE